MLHVTNKLLPVASCYTAQGAKSELVFFMSQARFLLFSSRCHARLYCNALFGVAVLALSLVEVLALSVSRSVP